MDSASIQFVLFGLAAALLSNFSRACAWRSTVLMLASLIFLVRLAPGAIALLPLAGFLLLGYGWLFLLDRGWITGKAWSILTVVLVYVWLKKYTFLPEGSFLRYGYFTLGLSYIFFRVLHLLIEAREGPERKPTGLGAYLLYTLNFTTFVSGPIQRYDRFAEDQFAEEPIALRPRVIGLQLERMVRGFFKVNVLALLFDMVRVDAMTQVLQPLPAALRLYAAFRLVLVYPVFLYANFSGYMDIVIALARLMRLRLPENFDRPFSASSVLEFWTRWHMTLSNWLKTYVYNPLLLGLMRRNPSPSTEPLLGVICFFVTFFLIGVWHGRTSEFVFFGVLTGGGVSLNKLWQLAMARALGRARYRELAKNSLYNALARGLNYVWFAFSLFWFWADWGQIDRIFGSLSVSDWLGVGMAALLFATAILAAWEGLHSAPSLVRLSQGPVLNSRYARVVYATVLGLVSLVVIVLLNQSAPEIVYKVF